MTVLAWLLLCVTVIQLGRSNYSISIENGVLSNSSFANSISPPIARSQARRARRSVESELAAAEKAHADADSARNATKTEQQRAAAAKSEAEARLKDAYKDTNRTADALRDATRVFNEADQKVTEADADQKKKDADFTKAIEAYEARMKKEFKDPEIQKKHDDLEKEYKNAEDALKKAEGDWKKASDDSTPFSNLLNDYNTMKVQKENYEKDITTYNTNYANDVAKKNAEDKIRTGQLQEKFNAAVRTRDTAKNAKSVIDNNEILNGKITGLDKTTIQQLVDDVKHTANKQAKELETFDKKSTIKNIRKIFNEMLRDAEECTNNKILNGDIAEKYEENGKKKTVAEVVTTKTHALTKARSEHDITVTEKTLETMKNSLDKAEEEYKCIHELWTLNKEVTLEDFKNDFLNNQKPAADKTVKMCENNDFLNGNIKDNFKTETIDQAMTRLKGVRDTAQNEYDNAEPAKQSDLQISLTKAENDLLFMNELEVTFGKKMLVEAAKEKSKEMKIEANTVINTAISNCILNGALPIDNYAGMKIADVDIQVQTENLGLDSAYTEKKTKFNNFEKAKEELRYIQQLETKFGGNKFVEDLKKAFKDKGAREANAIIEANKINTILNIKDQTKTYTKLDDKLVADALIEQEEIVAKAKAEFDKGKNTPRKDALESAHKNAQAVHRSVKQLKKYDSLLIGDLKKNLAKMKTEADAAFTSAEQELTNAETPLNVEKAIIAKAERDLNGAKLSDLEDKKDTALDYLEDGVSTQGMNSKFAKLETDLKTSAQLHSASTGESDWEKIKTKLNAETERLNQLVVPAKKKVTDLEKPWDDIQKEKTRILTSIQDNEGNTKTSAKTALEGANTRKQNAEEARRVPSADMKAAKKADDEAKAHLPHLEQAVRDAATALTNAILEDHAKREDLDLKLDLLNKAKDNKAEADKQEREHQETVRMLLGAFGGLGAIVFCALAIGLVAFFLMKRRKKVQKQKKSEKPAQPKFEEVESDVGLTILRREGTYDKYVIMGKDIPYNGPLIHRRAPKDLPVKHRLEDQVGGDKIENIFFDKKLNGAWGVGEGVEQWEEDSVGISDGREMLDGVLESEKAAKANKGDKKSSKRNGQKTPTKNPPSSSTDDQKKASTPSNPASTP